MSFKEMIIALCNRGDPVQVALPALGLVRATLREVQDDAVRLEVEGSSAVIFLHYTMVVVVT